VLKELKNLMAFLTIIPVGMDPVWLTNSANYIHLFPLVDAIIGAILAVVCVTLVFVKQKVVDYYSRLLKDQAGKEILLRIKKAPSLRL
jgi:cobalamin synthase